MKVTDEVRQDILDWLADRRREAPDSTVDSAYEEAIEVMKKADLSPTFLPEKQSHVVDFTKVGPDYICVCECGARWSTARSAGPDRLQESIKSHHISVGLKPSEVL
jgi:uncharacterized protein